MRRPFSFNINCQFFLRKNMFFCLKIKLSIHACLLSLYNKINLRNNNWLLNYDCSCCSRTLSWHLHSSFFYHFPIARFCVSSLSILIEHNLPCDPWLLMTPGDMWAPAPALRCLGRSRSLIVTPPLLLSSGRGQFDQDTAAGSPGGHGHNISWSEWATRQLI